MNTEWFQDLVYTHKVQAYISRKENGILRDDFIGTLDNGVLVVTEFPKGYRRKRYGTNRGGRFGGRPKKVTTHIEDQCRELNSRGLSNRKIAAILKISKDTVRRILAQN